MTRRPSGTVLSPAALQPRELRAVLACCGALSLAAIAWSWQHHAILNYGDAIAHLHIARRVLDSRFPGLTELGSVWLPLPHLLMLPFVQVFTWWANGVAGTIPSAIAWIASCIGLYRLARRWMPASAASVALAFFALNPNLLYLQTTAMTEPLFVCEMVWMVVGLVEWQVSLDGDPSRTSRLQIWICIVLLAGIYTRYDGWIMALLAWSAMGIILLRRGRLQSRSFWICSGLLVAAPLAWFAYNAIAFGDWLDFARGPYSAKAIEIRTAHGSGPPHPGWHNPWVGLLFYLKVSEMDAFVIGRHVALGLSVFGTFGAWFALRRRAFAWVLLLWLPVPFYAYSVAYSSVPIFIPVWWPHSWYNTRYGMELLPALALGVGFVAQFALAAIRDFKPRFSRFWFRYAAAALLVPVALNAWGLIETRPLVYVEGTLNLHARKPFDEAIPPVLRAQLARCQGGAVLMNTSVYPELVSLTGIPLRQTINESDRNQYREALAAPADHAAVVLAFDGDEIKRAVKAHPERLRAVAHFTAKGQPSGTLFLSSMWCRQAGLPPEPSPR